MQKGKEEMYIRFNPVKEIYKSFQSFARVNFKNVDKRKKRIEILSRFKTDCVWRDNDISINQNSDFEKKRLHRGLCCINISHECVIEMIQNRFDWHLLFSLRKREKGMQFVFFGPIINAMYADRFSIRISKKENYMYECVFYAYVESRED